ncbi:lysophospholipase [Sphingomonas sp.]|uniref:alpha/beta hydrolase n=1 Tax=Sphingomonas sp. TaxID=28214 RepID=UPI002B5B83F3|nr:lysophospholipase [Sphingomonas sp.]HWK35875.1 lysophospholipase [Sphingomonas sp.]
MADERIEQANGLGIHLRSWQPDGAPKAVVILQHGFNAHGGHMEWAAERFTAAGYACYAVDLRGRGQSDGERYYVEDFDDYVADLQLAFDRAGRDHPGLKTFLLGHSAGGVIACGYVLAHPRAVAGLICESFAFQVPAPAFALAALRGLSHLFPHAHVLKLKNADFSRDPAHVAMMDADPLIADEVQPTRTVAEMARADDALRTAFPRITLPVLILHGTADHATKWQGSQFFFDTVGATDKTLKLYDGHYHDLLADIGKEGVIADILAWVDARV